MKRLAVLLLPLALQALPGAAQAPGSVSRGVPKQRKGDRS